MRSEQQIVVITPNSRRFVRIADHSLVTFCLRPAKLWRIHWRSARDFFPDEARLTAGLKFVKKTATVMAYEQYFRREQVCTVCTTPDEPLWYYLVVSLVPPLRWFIAPWPIALVHVMPRQKGLPSGKLKQQENAKPGKA